MEEQSKRMNRILNKKANKLREELLNTFGIQKIDVIDRTISINAQMVSSDAPYNDIFQTLVQQIQSYVPPPILIAEQKQEPIPPENNSQESIPASPSQLEKRKLPVKPKEKVLDEWAAVIRHQDEMEQVKKEQEIFNQKKQQNQYRDMLEEQIKIRKLTVEGNKQVIDNKEKDIMGQFTQQAQQFTDLERKDAENKKKMAKELVSKMLQEKELTNKIKREEECKSKEEFKLLMRQQEDDEKSKQEYERQSRRFQNHAVNEQNKMQEQIKYQMKMEERQKDRIYSELQQKVTEKTEEDRQKYFNYIKQFQNKNDNVEYKQPSINMLSHIDEEKYINAIKEREKYEKSKEGEELRKKTIDLQNNKAFLDMQINEKFTQQQKIISDDKSYANFIKKSNTVAEEENKKRDGEYKMRLHEYSRELQQQMSVQEKLKRYKDVMSEHEKRINKKDIDAYIYDDPSKQLPPPSYPPTSQQNQPPTQSNEKLNIFETENQRYFQPKLINMMPQNNPVSKGSTTRKYYTNDKLYQEAEQNMNDPLIEQTRNVTYNRGYGYFNRKTYENE